MYMILCQQKYVGAVCVILITPKARKFSHVWSYLRTLLEHVVGQKSCGRIANGGCQEYM